jgi:hypothetical protein
VTYFRAVFMVFSMSAISGGPSGGAGNISVFASSPISVSIFSCNPPGVTIPKSLATSSPTLVEPCTTHLGKWTNSSTRALTVRAFEKFELTLQHVERLGHPVVDVGRRVAGEPSSGKASTRRRSPRSRL